jgi:hypothetical protein
MTRRDDLVRLRDAVALAHAYATDTTINDLHFRGWVEVEMRNCLEEIGALIAQEDAQREGPTT